jgi:rare lipoprotein A
VPVVAEPPRPDRRPAPQPAVVAAVPPAAPPVQQPDQPGGAYFIQAGAFSVYENADRLRSRLAPFGPVEVSPAMVEGVRVYRVRLGPIGSADEAHAVLSSVVVAGHQQAHIVTNY